MKLYYLLLILLLNSCAIKGNLAGLYSYYHKMQQQKPSLYVAPGQIASVCDIQKTTEPKIYVVNGLEVKKCLSLYPKALVYIWSPRCKSKICLPPELLQSKCTAKKLELFMVAEYYDNAQMDVDYRINRPILGIDTQYYHSDLTSHYLSKFIDDLGAKSSNNNRCLYFENGHFVQDYNFVDDIE
ncbi:MAG: hypothetical protein U0X58_07785 [Flavobacteriaceae bacterium]